MQKTIIELFREIWKAPAGKQVVGLCLLIAFCVPWFLGHYYADVQNDNKSLKLELKEERKNTERITNEYLSERKRWERKLRASDSIHIKKLDEYRNRQESYNEEKIKQLEEDYKEALQTLNQSKKVIDRTSKDLNIKK